METLVESADHRRVILSLPDNAKGAYTVTNLTRAWPAGTMHMPVQGNLFSINVIIEAESGSVTYNSLYFSARTEDGSKLGAANGIIDDQLVAGHLNPGQKIAGRVAFDVPPGKNITQIVLADYADQPLGLWSVS
jgi:hypothetical protein